MNILDALYEDGITPVFAARTKGGEYMSECPDCGGVDRFRIWPDKNRFWCRQCYFNGDLIEYYRRIRNLSFPQAKEKAGYLSQCKYYCIEKKLPFEIRKQEFRSYEWSRKSLAFIEWSANNLHDTPKGHEALTWLIEEKGINSATAREFKLGLNHLTFRRSREAWGLSVDESHSKYGFKEEFIIPSGLVIPSINMACAIDNIRIRANQRSMKYYLMPGSSMNYLVTGNIESDVCFIVESDLDAILLHQEAGDLACFIATGSTTNKPSSKDYAFIASKRTVFIAFDSDRAGMMAANSYWLPNFANAKRWPVQNGKDPSEAFNNGLELRDWINAAIYL